MIRRVLLDECVPRKLGRHLAPHVCSTVTKEGWNGVKNGRLLRLAETRFDVLLTVDKGLPDQQQVASLQLAVIVLRARSNQLQYLLPLVGRVLLAVPLATAGTVTVIGNDLSAL